MEYGRDVGGQAGRERYVYRSGRYWYPMPLNMHTASKRHTQAQSPQLTTIGPSSVKSRVPEAVEVAGFVPVI